MITILHGENTYSSYQALQEEKKKYRGKEIVVLDGNIITRADLELAVSATSLFTAEKLVVIEGLLTSRPSKRKDEAIDYLAKEKIEVKIILYEDKEVGLRELKKIPKAKAQNFKPNTNIFSFVDGIKVLNPKDSILKLQNLLTSEPPEIIYTMLVRQFRLLILVKEGNPKYLTALQSWQIGKFHHQAQYFSMEDLVQNYRKLLDIDYKIKFGLTPLSLSKLLDIFLLTL
ncbi:hypothetical protein HYW54_04225 [Candidatus Gottesmanbacteria bacterium]|nr:hypothetical protein [Candidatus Gottesmanbacteria bacterium]